MISVGRLALLFVLVPVIELLLLLRIGQLIGFWPTLAIVLITGWAGAVLARLEGLRVLARFQQELAMGKVPGQAILDGAAVLVGGAFLLAPGILTDLAGLALLFPPTRRLAQRWVRRRLEKGIMNGSIRVMTMAAGPTRTRRAEERREEAPRGLDPSKGIVIEPDDS
ncbi:MAG: FxsA family protein [Gemmatimonadales bacterium]